MANSIRYTLLLDKAGQDRLDRLQEVCGLSTRSAVIDLALNILDWMAEQKLEGHQIGREKNGKFHELLLPIRIRKPVAVSQEKTEADLP